ALRGLAFSPDGRTLASSSAGNEIRFWEAATGKELRMIQAVERTSGFYSGISPIAFSRDGKSLVSWGDDRRLRQWELATGKALSNQPIYLRDQPSVPAERPEKMPPFTERILAVEFSPDARHVALAVPQAIYVVDVATGRELVKLPGKHAVLHLAFSPDG